MPTLSTNTTQILYGSKLKIGYRLNGSTDAFTYVTYTPGYSELPYNFTVPTTGVYDIEFTELCPVCQGLANSKTVVKTITVI